MTVQYHSGIMRGCGKRQKGGVYIEVPTTEGEDGRPLEWFLLDPPQLVPENLDLPKRGVNLIERGGVWHVLDHVGEQNYPNVADIVEEIRRFGVSRRISKMVDVSKLTNESRLILAHRKAYIANWQQYRQPAREPWFCPKAELAVELRDRGWRAIPDVDPAHGHGTAFCAGIWWEDLVGGQSCPSGMLSANQLAGRSVGRKVGDTSYGGYQAPPGVTPRYHEAFFASFPIGRLAVVRDDGGEHRETVERLREQSRDRLPIEEVDE